MILGAALVPLAAGPASAAAPANDESTGAVALGLGDTVTQDTTQATTNAGDDTLNTNCGAPATNGSVWYKYSPSVKRNVALDVSASNYSAGLMVFQGTPTADSLVTCGPGEVGLHVRAGQTYFIMAFSDTAGVVGGNLVLSLKNAPKPRVHVTLAKKGVAFRGGAAKLHGTYSCTHADSFAELDTHLFQRAGRLKIQGDSGTGVLCNGRRHKWSTRIVSPIGTYAPGSSIAKVSLISCGLVQCSLDRAKAHVHLARGSAKSAWMTHPTTIRSGHRGPLVQRHWPSS
jgi:hypothetical protein